MPNVTNNFLPLMKLPRSNRHKERRLRTHQLRFPPPSLHLLATHSSDPLNSPWHRTLLCFADISRSIWYRTNLRFCTLEAWHRVSSKIRTKLLSINEFCCLFCFTCCCTLQFHLNKRNPYCLLRSSGRNQTLINLFWTPIYLMQENPWIKLDRQKGLFKYYLLFPLLFPFLNLGFIQGNTRITYISLYSTSRARIAEIDFATKGSLILEILLYLNLFWFL